MYTSSLDHITLRSSLPPALHGVNDASARLLAIQEVNWPGHSFILALVVA